MNNNAFQNDFFILYEVENEQDTECAKTILEYLENTQNLRGWVEFRDSQAGLSVFRNFENAVKNSRFVLFLISEESVQDGWWDRQMETALLHHLQNAYREKIVPIFLPNLNVKELPASLAVLNGVSYNSDPNNLFWRKLAQVFQ